MIDECFEENEGETDIHETAKKDVKIAIINNAFDHLESMNESIQTIIAPMLKSNKFAKWKV